MKPVELGRIAKPHGIRGEVKVRLHWGGSEVLCAASHVLVHAAGPDDRLHSMRIEHARRVPDGILLKLAGVDDRSAAEQLRGASVALERSELPEPAEGEYYLTDLVGARLLAPEGDIGEIIGVRVHGTRDTLVVRTDDGRELEQVLDAAWVDEVDLEHNVVRLSSTDGLI